MLLGFSLFLFDQLSDVWDFKQRFENTFLYKILPELFGIFKEKIYLCFIYTANEIYESVDGETK